MKKAVFLIFFSFLATGALAQSPKALQKKYEYGKDFLRQKQYQQALVVFESVAATENRNPYRKHALYLYALAAYQSGRPSLARNALFELVRKFPDWKQINEARYLLALTEMETGKYAPALEHLQKIKSPSFSQDIEALLQTGLADAGIRELEALYKRYDFLELGQLLWDKLQPVKSSPEYRALYTQLQPEFGNGEVTLPGQAGEIAPPKPGKAIFKDTWRVAAMLPFRRNLITPASISTNQRRVLDLWEGIRLAVEQLNSEGKNFELFAFDTNNDSLSAVELINDPAFGTMDLIMGPLYPATIPVVGDYAGMNAKTMVNPVSSNELIISGNPYAFLTSSTSGTIIDNVLAYATDSLNSPRAYIIHGGKASESEIAEAYASQFADKGGEVMSLFPFDYSKEGFQNLMDELAPLQKDSLAHVFIAADAPVVALNTISAMESMLSRAPIFASKDWLDMNQMDFEQLEKMKVYFYHPQFYDTDEPATRAFIRKYVQRLSFYPSPYAFMGYASMYFFGSALHKYGSQLPVSLHKAGFVPGLVYPGYNYDGGNDNQYVPIVRFVKGSLEVVNYPEPEQSLSTERY